MRVNGEWERGRAMGAVSEVATRWCKAAKS